MDDPEKLDENSQASQTITPPSISLPKGGGAIRGIDKKSDVIFSTGIGSNTITVPPSHGCSNVSPQHTHSYNSGIGNCLYGFGMSLFFSAKTHRTDKGKRKYLSL